MNTKFLGKKVIIRADKAGVFYGTLITADPLGDKLQVELHNCRRLWRWAGAFSLTQLAIEGTKDPDSCKFTMAIDAIVIGGAIEIIPCTKDAIKSIEDVQVWKL